MIDVWGESGGSMGRGEPVATSRRHMGSIDPDAIER
jgi:hypothetical protein